MRVPHRPTTIRWVATIQTSPVFLSLPSEVPFPPQVPCSMISFSTQIEDRRSLGETSAPERKRDSPWVSYTANPHNHPVFESLTGHKRKVQIARTG